MLVLLYFLLKCNKYSNQSQKALIFDPFSGASGDMIIASLIDLGANSKKIIDAMELVSNVSFSINRINKNGIDATNDSFNHEGDSLS